MRAILHDAYCVDPDILDVEIESQLDRGLKGIRQMSYDIRETTPLATFLNIADLRFVLMITAMTPNVTNSCIRLEPDKPSIHCEWQRNEPFLSNIDNPKIRLHQSVIEWVLYAQTIFASIVVSSPAETHKLVDKMNAVSRMPQLSPAKLGLIIQQVAIVMIGIIIFWWCNKYQVRFVLLELRWSPENPNPSSSSDPFLSSVSHRIPAVDLP